MIRKIEDARDEVRVNMRGGAQSVTVRHLLEESEMGDKAKLCAILSVEPGSEIGLHSHGPDAEIFFMVKGELSMTDNGQEVILKAGDTMWTGAGDSHSVINKTNEVAEILAVVMK